MAGPAGTSKALEGARRPPASRIRRARALGAGFHALVLLAALGLLGLAALLLRVLLAGSAQSFRLAGWGFLGGSTWDVSRNVYGALPAIEGTVLTSALALLLAVPVAFGVAIFLSESCPARLRSPLTYLVELSAAIPSVVYGLWALLWLVPLMRSTIEPGLTAVSGGRLCTSTATGSDLLTASLVLAIMVLPTIAAVSRETLRATPRVQRESALSLGATRWEATRLAVLGPARNGLAAAVLLGLGRAVGETMAVLMVVGNNFGPITSLCSPGVTLASWIANDFSAAGPTESSALVELGLVLFAVSMGVNIVARLVLHRARPAPGRASLAQRASARVRRLLRRGEVGEASGSRKEIAQRLVCHRAGQGAPTLPAWWQVTLDGAPQRLRRRQWVHRVVLGATAGCLLLAALPLVLVLGMAVAGGGAELLRPAFYTSSLPVACNPGYCPSGYQLGGIGPAIQGSLLLLGFAAVVALPVGLLAGIYLSEYRGRPAAPARGRWAAVAASPLLRRLGGPSRGLGRALGSLLSFLAEVMTGVPTVLLGVVVVVLFQSLDPNDQRGLIAGGLALGALMFPIVARATEEALRSVPASVREAALALGFPRHRVVLRVVVGSGRNALVTGALLSLSRAAGDTAAILLTAGFSYLGFLGVDQPMAALPTYVYFLVGPYQNWEEAAWGAALVLLLIMLGVGLLARLVTRGRGATAEVV